MSYIQHPIRMAMWYLVEAGINMCCVKGYLQSIHLVYCLLKKIPYDCITSLISSSGQWSMGSRKTVVSSTKATMQSFENWACYRYESNSDEQNMWNIHCLVLLNMRMQWTWKLTRLKIVYGIPTKPQWKKKSVRQASWVLWLLSPPHKLKHPFWWTIKQFERSF